MSKKYIKISEINRAKAARDKIKLPDTQHDNH